MVGGYDDGYSTCRCFWGTQPGSLVRKLEEIIATKIDNVLDVGCGEGKNAVHYSKLGASVLAIDISDLAIRNGRALWPTEQIRWEVADARTFEFDFRKYDLAIAYGLLHCLDNEREIRAISKKIIEATAHGGHNLICAFNSRKQDLTAHPNFSPTLLSHEQLLDLYRGHEVLFESDSDLVETHPHNNIEHSHSLTRIIVRASHD
jgi:2-polyprenyl-3-methyl-5-hydroxy-6-metoxy-1,4-benzoquinol methylase